MKRTKAQIIARLDPFTRGYLVCALWSSNDESDDQGGDPIDQNYGVEGIAKDSLLAMIEECRTFQTDNAETLAAAYGVEIQTEWGVRPYPIDYAGHDFWLTRNHHGAGFWDRCLGAIGDALTAAAEKTGEAYLYVHRGYVHQN